MGSTPHSLAGVWTGSAFLAPSVSLTISEGGQVSALLVNGNPSTTFLGGYVDESTDMYTVTMTVDAQGPTPMPFLVDPAKQHGALVLVQGGLGTVVALQRDAGAAPLFFEDDIVGGWDGYGCAYDQPSLGFAIVTPVSATATDGTPHNDFAVTLPGSNFTGVFDTFVAPVWRGTANVTSANVPAVMTADKHFVAVQAWPPSVTGLEDFSFFALNRQ